MSSLPALVEIEPGTPVPAALTYSALILAGGQVRKWDLELFEIDLQWGWRALGGYAEVKVHPDGLPGFESFAGKAFVANVNPENRVAQLVGVGAPKEIREDAS